MKTVIRLLVLGLAILPLCAFAQKTEPREYEFRVAWDDLDGFAENVSYKVPVYYDNDDNLVKHGPLAINYRSDLSARINKKCIITYKVSGNYVNGKLNGVLSLEKAAYISQGSIVTKGTLNFVNGVPGGTATFTEISTMNGQSRTITCTVTIKDKQLVSYSDGKNKFKINADNTFSGKINGEIYKNRVNTSSFIRKTGEKSKLDETTLGLVNAFIAGSLSESKLIAKGYAFEKNSWIYNFNYDRLSNYVSKLDVDHFMDEKATTISFASIMGNTQLNKEVSPTYTLKRVNVISANDLVAKASSIKEATNLESGQDEVYWSTGDDSSFKWYRYYRNLNAIELSGDDYSRDVYYFTDEAKLKFEEALAAAIKERKANPVPSAQDVYLQNMFNAF